ncbi:MAG: DUF4019 domain-containing protein [Burkholderiales bacterium]
MTWLQRGLTLALPIAALACAAITGPAAAAEPAAGSPPPAATDAVADGNAAGAIAAATEESDRWLDLIAHAKFTESWVEAAVVLQEAVPQKAWVDDLTARHAKLGRLIMRERKTASYSKVIRGAPTGDYVTVIYLTKFEKAPLADETLALAKDAFGQWHVAGYDIALAPTKAQ